MDAINQGRHQPMKDDGFQPDRAPIFLSGYPDEAGQPDTARGWDIATISSRILKASILAVTVTAIGIAVLAVGNPVTLVANMTDWWIDKPVLQSEADSTTSTIQTAAATQDLPATVSDAPPRDETAATGEPADQGQAETGQRQAEAAQSQTETGPPVTEELFKQFQAWAAEEETRAQAAPAQAAPVRVAQDGPAQTRPVKKQRRARSVQNARAEIRPQRHHRARVQEEQDPRGQVPPGGLVPPGGQLPSVADPRAVDPSGQNGPPSFLQSLGFRN
jgi:hypothetical protein